MINQIHNLPANMVGFRATSEVTEDDFSNVVMPQVKELIAKTDVLNYLLVLDTSVSNFTAGAWFKDAIMGIKHLTKWNRAAIVSDVKAVKTFTDIFSVIMPGEFKVFEHANQQEAIVWVSGNDI